MTMQQPMTPSVADVVTASEALQILGLKNRSSISVMVRCGELTPFKRLPLGNLYLRSDVEALRDARAGRGAA